VIMRHPYVLRRYRGGAGQLAWGFQPAELLVDGFELQRGAKVHLEAGVTVREAARVGPPC
jgi:hypothetical protein